MKALSVEKRKRELLQEEIRALKGQCKQLNDALKHSGGHIRELEAAKRQQEQTYQTVTIGLRKKISNMVSAFVEGMECPTGVDSWVLRILYLVSIYYAHCTT